MRMNDEKIPNGRMYVVAGGPSLMHLDWSLLRDRRTLAVNRSYEKLPTAEAIYFSDYRFWEWHRKELVRHQGHIYTGQKRIVDRRVQFVKWTGIKGLETQHNKIRHGNNSGYAAINLAVHLGAEEIVLLGYDMKLCGERTHWHEGHPVKLRPRVFDNMLRYFETLVEPLETLGINIINASPDSAIECFKKATLEEVL